jgi:hypothetical protein
MDLMPYFDQIWFGEGFSYDRGPDYYLVEISGICVGLTGQMLEYHTGGNPWRGMLFGMPPYAVAPQFEAVMAIPEWFDIDSAELLGYWDDACPVSTGREDVLSSVYRLEGRSLIAVASWAGEDRNVRLEIDWDALGLDPATAHLRAPAMEHFQGPRTFQPDDAIPVPPGRGLLLLAEPADTPATE